MKYLLIPIILLLSWWYLKTGSPAAAFTVGKFLLPLLGVVLWGLLTRFRTSLNWFLIIIGIAVIIALAAACNNTHVINQLPVDAY